MSTVTLSNPHCAITSAENPEGIASQAFTTALPEAQTFFTLFVVIRFPSVCLKPLSSRGGCLGMAAEIGGGDGFVAPQFVGLAAEDDAAGFQHVAVLGHRQSHPRVLLDQQHRGVAPDLRDDPEHRLHDHRRQPCLLYTSDAADE